jgi:2-hydroxyglutarate dehydrogenase
MGAAAVTAGGLYMANANDKNKVHAESNQKLSFWEALPGENLPVNEGLAKLRGFAAEQRFRTALAQHNGKTDFDVVIGK